MVVFYHIFPAFAIPFSKIFEKSPKNFCCPPSTFAAHTSKARVPFIDFLAYPLYLSNNNPAIYQVTTNRGVFIRTFRISARPSY